MTTSPATPRERLSELEYALGWRLVRGLPEPVARRLFDTGGRFAARRGPVGERLRANLARVAPAAGPAELDALAVAAMRSYARYWCEAFRFTRRDLPRVHAGTRLDGPGVAALREVLATGAPLVVALPHSGNWDAAGMWLVEELRAAGRRATFTTVVQRQRPESLHRRFVGYRTALGMEVVATDDVVGAHRALTRRLRAGGVVCLLADRDVTGAGLPVTFLGGPARVPRGPAALAALTGATLLPVCAGYPARHGWGVTVAEPVPVAGRAGVPAATQALADALATLIRRAPADWHAALQPIWLDRLGPVPDPAPGASPATAPFVPRLRGSGSAP